MIYISNYTSNGKEYKVTGDSYENSLELLRFIKEEGLDGEDVLNLMLDWHGTALTSEAMMNNTFDCEFGLTVKEDESDDED